MPRKHKKERPSNPAAIVKAGASRLYQAPMYSKEHLTGTLGVDFDNKIGKGSQGKIYTNPQGHRTPLIVKVISSHREFEAEMGCLDALPRHAGIVQLYGYSIEDDFHAVVLEKLAGPNLKEKILDFGWKDTIKLLKQIAEALRHVHDCGFVHADIKPKNIVFDKDGRAKLIDFGASLKEGKTPQISTEKYVAPEGIRLGVNEVTTKYDSFSYGVIALQLLMKEKSPGERDIKVTRKGKHGQGKCGPSKPKHITEVATNKRGPLIHEQLRLSPGFDEGDGNKLLEGVFKCVKYGVGSRPMMKDMISLLDEILEGPSKG